MKLNKAPATTERLILSSIADSLNFIAWTKTKDAQKNRNKPKSILKELTSTKEDKEITSFNTGNEFDRRREEILRSIKDGY